MKTSLKNRLISMSLALVMILMGLCSCATDESGGDESSASSGGGVEVMTTTSSNGDQTPDAEEVNLEENKSLFYFNDPGHILSCINENNPSRSQIVTKTRLDAAVTEATDAGFDVFVNEIYGMVPWYPSEVLPVSEHLDWFYNEFGGKDDGYGFLTYAKNGNDFVQIQLDKTHEEGKLYFLSYRMNDLHNLSIGDNPNQAAIQWISEFWQKNPQYRIGQAQNQLGAAANMLDFQYAEVREYKLNMIYELIENYDIDGILLDFMRAPAYFNLNTTTESQRVLIMKDFAAKVKLALDAKSAETGKEYYFGVVLPLEDNEYVDLGFNIDAFCQAGVDLFIFWDYYFTRQEYDLLEEVKSEHPEVLAYAMVSQATSYKVGGDQVYRYTTAEQWYTCAYTAYAHGADGISMFNLPFYRNWQYSPGTDVGYEVPFDIVNNLKNTEFLESAGQHYFHGIHYNHLNAEFSLSRIVLTNSNKSFNFTFDMTAPKGGWTSEYGILRLEASSDVSAVDFTVKVNGVTVAATEYKDAYEVKYPDLIGDEKQFKCYEVPIYLLENGDNVFNVTKNTSTSSNITFTFIDLTIQ
ncbi:MAG: hypothetical protein IJ038_03755 [Clostridia bacterium]|nr:hypothetical protein [Clostridia bacterium]